MTTTPRTRRRSGTARFCDVSALTIAVPLGLVIAFALAAVKVAGLSAQDRWLAMVIMSAFLAIPTICLAWPAVVDRASLPGTPADLEASVETAWTTRAGSGTFTDICIAAGIGLFLVPSHASWSGPVSITLIAVLVFAFLDFTVRHLLISRRGR